MKIIKIVLISLVSLASLIAALFFLIGYLRPKPGGISIDTNPSSNIYINGNLAGKTPYSSSLPAGGITLKLVPAVPQTNLVPYETKITLVSGIQTVVRREFGRTEEESSGVIVSFDKQNQGETGLIVISKPENAQVSIDGVAQGFTPYKTSTISPAEHQIAIRAPGYSDKTMSVKTMQGFRLSFYVKLARTVENLVPTPTPTPPPRPMVEILQTPTGFLRIRTEPGIAGEEIGQAKVGSLYPFLDTDVATGWIKIQFEDPAPGLPNGITGWVSGQYVKKVEIQ